MLANSDRLINVTKQHGLVFLFSSFCLNNNDILRRNRKRVQPLSNLKRESKKGRKKIEMRLVQL